MTLPFEEIRNGNLGVRVAASQAEIEAGQRLRYQVFVNEMGARPDAAALASGMDCDRYDAVADHLLVLDHDRGEGAASVVGTYRLIRRCAAAKIGRFYSADEYDIAPLVDYPAEILELGRSCVATEYRTRGTLQMLWQGIADYVQHYDIALMFGCASLPGLDLGTNAAALTYLHQHHLAPEALRPRAVAERYVSMDRLAPGSYDAKAALLALPPLIKGYLRLGGFVGDGAVLDEPFNTTDVCVIVKTDLVTQRYSKHYRRGSGLAR